MTAQASTDTSTTRLKLHNINYAGHCGASLSKQYAKDYNCACAVRIHACPYALLVEVSKLAWCLVRSKVAVCLLCLIECINDKGSVVHYSHRNDLVIESLQVLANPHLVFCLGVRNNELVWKRLTFFVYTITVMVYQFLL